MPTSSLVELTALAHRNYVSTTSMSSADAIMLEGPSSIIVISHSSESNFMDVMSEYLNWKVGRDGMNSQGELHYLN